MPSDDGWKASMLRLGERPRADVNNFALEIDPQKFPNSIVLAVQDATRRSKREGAWTTECGSLLLRLSS